MVKNSIECPFLKSSSSAIASIPPQLKSNGSYPLSISNAWSKLVHKPSSREIYFNLNGNRITEQHKVLSQYYLQDQLQEAHLKNCDLPATTEGLSIWIRNNVDSVGKEYREYLNERKAGGARWYFKTKSHALNFLQSVGPTKLVDGSWLYGCVHQWQDARFSSLIKIYLEELGDGQSAKNHVVLYKKLLNDNGCNEWQSLPDDYFIQGAIQLSLGYNIEEFLPEAIGFNLGYEQLPLHLLITAYELKELDIDPSYFTLHVTVDNASTGHARTSLRALTENLPVFANKTEFYQRVIDGYRLNQIGLGTTQIISAFDLEKEFTAILSAKSVFGRHMHSDVCKIGGTTVSQWLGEINQIPQFIDSLCMNGWIKRHQDPHQSRFWKLIEGENAKMCGVFSVYEKQIIYDWIAGDSLVQRVRPQATQSPSSSDGNQDQYRHFSRNEKMKKPGVRENITSSSFDPDVSLMREKLACLHTKEEIMALLVSWMSPAVHHTNVGLMATKLYKSILEKSRYENVLPMPIQATGTF